MPYYDDGSGRAPRYYQASAINNTIEAVARGQRRALLVMATGTGKTYTAFQIIWRLWKSGTKKRILFLADRNILVDQTKNNDFKPFGAAMTKITKRQIDKSYEIYLSLYQAVTGNEEDKNIYKQFSPDFFDLIVVDECHRGSAAEDSAWREVLEYFSNATHIGLTATPKETKDVSSITYFGEPVYSYTLKQGIEDGFLAPYKVVRIDIDKDLQGWRPTAGQVDKKGQMIEDRIYNQSDMDRALVLEKRTELVAKKITEYLAATDPYAKTIVFCDDIDHAERMRQALVNANPSRVKENRKYVMRITGDENEGKAELDNFINPEERYPVIATTSKLMTTGVDAQTCKLVVLDQHIKSMTEFKQIIGRGTRINEDYGKYWFTIMDFKKATELFADKDFDGEPVVIFEPKGDESPVPPDDEENDTGADNKPDITLGDDNSGGEGRIKYVVDNVEVRIVAQRVQYYGSEGKLITESLKDYTKTKVKNDFASLDDFLKTWSSAERKAALIAELEQHGVLIDALAEEVGKDFDPFDLVCHVAFDQPPLTRKERAEQVKKRNYFAKYGEQARQVLNALLDKYADTGVENIEDIKILTLDPFKSMGSAPELISAFGGKPAYLQDIMRKDVGVDGDAQRLSQLVWLLFLKIFDDRETEWDIVQDNYQSPLPEKYSWRNWAADAEGMTGEALKSFIDNNLFPALQNLQAKGSYQRAYVIRSVFEDAYNYMKSGQLIRQVINKIQEGVDFNKAQERHLFGDMYEQLLRDLQAAGNAGEFYTPRAVTEFMVRMANPRLGEKIMDPACGTGGFLSCTIEHIRKQDVKTVEDEATLQANIYGIEKKPLPHMLCTTNMILHGIEVPSNIRHDNTLARPLISWEPKDRVDVVITNPPFGGMEEDGIETNFPTTFRTRETADLFLVLIMQLLKTGGRAALVLPDGFLFGEGIKTRIKEKLLQDCNLHTIVRLPNSVFAPYTSIKTNLLFFTKGTPTQHIWFYEQQLPSGIKAYNKTKPMKVEEFETLANWWGNESDGFSARQENEQAWKVSLADIQARNYNLDCKNPHVGEQITHDPEVLLAQYHTMQQDIASLRNQLKNILGEALNH